MTVQYQGVWSLQSAAQLQSTQRWVTDPLFDYTTLLLQADDAANGAQNNTFLDSSSNSFAITRNGNTTQGSFTPFSLQPGAWANYFGGTSYLSSTSTALITNAVSTFTVESWVYFTATPPASGNFISSFCTLDGQPAGPTNFLSFGPLNDGKLYLFWFDGAVKYASGNTVLALNTWYHIACVVNSNSIQFYVNGVPEVMGNTTTLTNRSGTQGNFAVASSSGGQITGYISNFRVTTTAVYTSRFTPPTGPLTPVTGTVLLTCQSNQFVDANTQVAAKALTINGTPSVQAFSPFAPQFQWTPSVIGGSGYFDGSGDFLQTPSNAALGMSTGDFTIECWYYQTSRALTNTIIAPSTDNLNIYINTSGILGFYDGSARNSTTTVPLNTWNHIALVRSGSTATLYFNGVSVVSQANTINYATASWYVGRNSGGTDQCTGYCASARILKGTALYTGTFAPPTVPLTAITNTQLLLNFTNAGIYDGTMKNNLETVGNASVSTSIVKYGSGSMAFDGSGDYLVVGNMFTTPNLALLAGDFTIEYWYYPLNTNIHATLNNLDDNAGNGSLWILMNGTFSGGSRVQFGYNTGGANANILFGSGTFAINQWYHIAITRQGPAMRCFVNGIQEGSTNTGIGTGSIGAYNRNLVIGATLSGGSYTAYNLNGYLDDFRLTKGIARYTSNFIPPSVALPRQ